MQFTEAQRFIYSLSLMMFVTMIVLAALNMYAFDLFIALFIIEFLALTELTRPVHSRLIWRKNMAAFLIICAMIFIILLYTRIIAPY